MKSVGRSSLPAVIGAWMVVAVIAVPGISYGQQDLGHKVPGTLGLDAGAQRPAGLYAAGRLLYYYANRAIDRRGAELPVGLNLDAVAGAVGLGLALEITPIETFVNVSAGVPLATVHGSTDRPETSIDRFGLGDLYVQPLGLGWRLPCFDIVTAYAFYAPTGRSAPGGSDGVGRGHWTHQYSLGGTLYFDADRSWRFSVLGSHDWNQRKRDVDITRGDTVQLQGGLGGSVHPLLIVGITGYALWQVEDDRGSDLPMALRGARERAFGLGPEASLLLKELRSRLTVRYAHDVSARSRPLGGILSIEFGIQAWGPR